MTTAIRPGIYRILKAFDQDRSKRIHLRELSRLTHLHGQSIVRYLKALETEKILRVEKQGNLKLYSLADNQVAYAILALLDVERVRELPLLRRQAIAAYLRVLPAPPVFAVLFGSTAKGAHTDASDIDLLLVTHAWLDAKKAEQEAAALCAVRISTFQLTYADFIKEIRLKEDPVVQSAINSGYPLVNHVAYYEAVRHERAGP